MMPNLIKLFALVVFIGTALFPISALASSHSEKKASGEGAATISGWTTSNIHYELASDPSLVKSVSFDLDAAASAVSLRLASNSAAYASCVNLNAYHWQCDFPAGISLASLDEFHVIAVGD